MEINKLILHIMDTAQNIFVPSDIEIDKMNEEVYPIIESKLKKIFNSQNRKQADFKDSIIEKWIFEYKTSEIDFQTLSVKIAQYYFEEKRKFNLFQTSDFILAEVKHEDVRYIVGIDNVNFSKLAHLTQSNADKIKNEILLYKTLFSNSIMKEDKIFIVEFSNSNLQLLENPYVFQTNKVYVLQEILSCTAKPSYKETITAITECVEKLSNKYHMDEIEVIPALKAAIKDSITEEQKIQSDEIAELLFDNPIARSEFKDEMKNLGIQECLLVDNIKLGKQEKTQKIKTDNGIEITIPVELMNSKDIVEFVTEADGKISIRLKNIQSISSK